MAAELILKVALGIIQLIPDWMNRHRYTYTLRKQADAGRKITHSMNHFLVDHGGDRILLLRANNGTGVPKYGRPHYVTLVDYVSRREWSENSTTWEQVLLDEWYRSVLLDISVKGVMDYHVDDVDSGMLQKVYAKNSVKRIVFLHIVELPKEYWFAVIHICDDQDDETSDRIVKSVERSRNYLQGNLSKLLKQVTC